jgi:hypothetical protein
MLASESESAQIERLPHKTWTRGEVAVLEGIGLFDGTHFELIEGELIDKTGKLRPHVIGLKCSRFALEDVFGKDFVDTDAPEDRMDIASGHFAKKSCRRKRFTAQVLFASRLRSFASRFGRSMARGTRVSSTP